MEDVRLPDLEVIRRYSIAVRAEHAPAEDVIEALRADLARLTGRARVDSSASAPGSTRRSTSSVRPVATPARRAATPARRAATPARRSSPARKAATRSKPKRRR